MSESVTQSAAEPIQDALKLRLQSSHRGSKYLAALRVEMSPLGERVADLLGHLFKGLYHADYVALRGADWKNDSFISIRLASCRLATWDFNELTELVVLCHDLCIRCQISPCSPKQVSLMFHARSRTGGMSRRHPEMEEALKLIRAGYSVTTAEVA